MGSTTPLVFVAASARAGCVARCVAEDDRRLQGSFWYFFRFGGGRFGGGRFGGGRFGGGRFGGWLRE
jgi:hypothetical protein